MTSRVRITQLNQEGNSPHSEHVAYNGNLISQHKRRTRDETPRSRNKKATLEKLAMKCGVEWRLFTFF